MASRVLPLFQRGSRRAGAALVLLLAALPGLRAGPPFLTDDPEPVDLHHWEFYTFGQADRTSDSNAVSAPSLEFNYGIAPNAQLHLVTPLSHVSSPGSGWVSGYGDTEVGLKYRFLDETDSHPQIGIFPMAELATGDGARGLGNGRTWYRLPLWMQKSRGPWTTYGGGGEALNSAPGQRNYGFAGWLVQRDLGRRLTLGIELYHQGADTAGGRECTLANLGGYLKFGEDFNLLFSGGRSISGERHTVWYLGLYWTGSAEKAARQQAPAK